MTLRSSMLSSVLFSPLRLPPGEGDPPADPPAPDSDESHTPGAADPPADPPAAAAGDGDPPADPPADPPVPAVRDWRDREIGRKHAQLQEAKRQEADLRRENEELRAIAARAAAPKKEGEADPPVRSDPPASRANDDERIKDEAARLVARENYDRACNDVFQKGSKDHGPKWNDALDNIKLLGGLDYDAMTGVLATDDPARVLFTLGANPDEYHRVMALPPAKRLNEMAKIAATPAPKVKKISDAAPPVDPIQGRGVRDAGALDDELDDDTWFARRKAQKLDKYKRDRAAGLV